MDWWRRLSDTKPWTEEDERAYREWLDERAALIRQRYKAGLVSRQHEAWRDKTGRLIEEDQE